MLVRFKLANKAKQRAISHYFRRCKAVLSNYLSEDELKSALKNLKKQIKQQFKMRS
jgi:hypothetical protein